MANRDWLEVVDACRRGRPIASAREGFLRPIARRAGGISRLATPRATRCTPGCSASRERLAAAESNAESDPDYLEVARDELYRGQCGSAYRAWRLRRALSALSE